MLMSRLFVATAGLSLFIADPTPPVAFAVENAPGFELAFAPSLAPRGGGGGRRSRPRPPSPQVLSPIPVPDCIPESLRPPTGNKARTSSVGNVKPNVVGTYVEGLSAIYCDAHPETSGWPQITQAALAGYRPAVRALASEAIERPEVLNGDAEAAFAMLLKEARAGSTSAMTAVGVLYRAGTGVAPDAGQAVSWFTRAASKGNQDSTERLAIMKALGEGTKDNAKASRQLLEKLTSETRAARAVVTIMVGLVGANRTGSFHEELSDWASFGDRRFPSFRTALTLGFEDMVGGSCVNCPVREILQVGVALDVPRALSVYGRELLADPERVAEGIGYLGRAATRGDPDAAGQLARLAVEDDITAEESAAALSELRGAAQAGSPTAMLAYANTRIFAKQAPADEQPDTIAALEAAAAAGSPEAQQRLGILYALGAGVERDVDKAREWLGRAGLNGMPTSDVIRRGLNDEQEQ